MMRRGAQRLVPALLVILGVTLLPTVRAGMAPTQVAQARPAQPDSHFGRLPLAFEANEGQLPGSTRFLARGAGFVLLLQERGATLELPQVRGTAHGSFQSGRIGAVTVLPVRGSRHPRMVGLDRLPGIANYFIGRDPRQWHTDIPTFARVRYQDVYPGIDLEYYGRQGTLDYDWIIHPGANPGIVQMEIEQVSAMGIDRAGSLVVQSAGPKLVQRAPIAYQTLHGVRRSVGVRYLLEGGHRFSFQLNGYDRTQLLIIDPSLAYATTLGGSGQGIAVDGAGDVYVTGNVNCDAIPAVRAAQPKHSEDCADPDAYVEKLGPAGNALLYSTYLGGNGPDYANGIAVDGAGDAYVVGETNAEDFPVANPFQGNKPGGPGFSGYVAKLAPNGDRLLYSTYLGAPSGDTAAQAIAVDGSGSAFVAGRTEGRDFPTVAPLQPAKAGRSANAFLTKFDPTGRSLVYSTYLGGSDGNGTEANGVAVDAQGSAYLTGSTTSTDFPTVGPLQPSYAGTTSEGTYGDAFVAKIDPGGKRLVYSTYLGGSADDNGEAIAVDGAGNAYVTGATASTVFPVAHPLQRTMGSSSCGRCEDIFISKLTADGKALAYSTYLGGGDDEAHGIAVDSAGEAYVAGVTRSTDFPTLNAIQPANGAAGGGINAVVAKLTASGGELVYSTYLGGSQDDNAFAIALDSSGSAYVTGFNQSSDFPAVNPLPSASKEDQGFVAKITEGGTNLPTATPPTEPTLPTEPTVPPATVSHPTATPTPSAPTPTPGPIPTVGAHPTAAQLWKASSQAMAQVKTVHTQGVLTIGQTVSFISDCSTEWVRLHIVFPKQAGIPKKEQHDVIFLMGPDLNPKGAWTRVKVGEGSWTQWKAVTGEERGAALFSSLLYIAFSCPQEVGSTSSKARNLHGVQVTSSTLGGQAAWHLHRQGSKSSPGTSDDYIAKATLYLLRSTANSPAHKGQKARKLDVRYSRFNEPLNIQPPVAALASAVRRR